MDTHSLHTPTSFFVAKGAILNKDYITLFKKKKREEKSVVLLPLKMQPSDRDSPYLPGLQPLIPSRGSGGK